MSLSARENKPRAALYRIEISGQKPFTVAHFCMDEAWEHAEMMADLGAAITVREVKKCTKCAEVKPLSEFSPAKAGVSGVSAECKVCLKMRKAVEAQRARDIKVGKGMRFDNALACQFLRGALMQGAL